MNNVATVKHPRLTATLWGDLLCSYIPDAAWAIHVRYRGGDLAMKVDCLEARVLARRRMIAGLVSKGTLRYLVLLAPKSDAVRMLRMDPPRPGEITIPRASDMQWPVRCDRARGGRLGGHQSFDVNCYERIEHLDLVDASRRIVA